MLFVGVDPGVTGAVAIIAGTHVQVFDTPTAELKAGRRKKTVFVPREMARTLKDKILNLLGPGPGLSSPLETETFCVLEKVHSMPGQGVSSSFSFGEGYGMWQGILATLGIPYELVTPQAWKKEMMAGMGIKEKGASRVRALELFPQMTNILSRVKDHGRADAILIAAYGRRRHGSH